MLFHVKKAVLAVTLAAFPLLSFGQAESAVGGQMSCHGEMFNPMSDVDWNNLYPITIGGFKMNSKGNATSPLQYEPSVCTCPGPFGIPSYGIGVTYWEPVYIAEIERSPGCMSSLGGKKILKGYDSLHSEQIMTFNGPGQTSRMQMHWYEYPVFKVVDIMQSMACKNTGGFALVGLTEIDPFWQSDEWAAVFSPDSSLFASLPAQAACAIDAVAATVHYPIDALIWCAGTWGSVYPFSGNSPHTNSNFSSNNLVLAKYIARQTRLGLMWQTIGPTAMCFTHPAPVWLKSQYRFNQVAPIARRGSTVEAGNPGAMLSPPVTNHPTRESTVDMVWRARQCCARLY
jgi:conjugal transfer pilus assembly protein TraU